MHIRSRGLMRGKYNYGHALASAQWTVSSRRQCRTGWPKALQATSAAGSGRPHDVRQRIVRGQAVGLARRPGQIMGVGLGATGRRGISRLGIDPLSIAGPLAVVFGRDIDAMPMTGQLRYGEGRVPHSAGHTRPWPHRPRLLLGSGRPHDIRKCIVRRQAVGFPRCSRERVGMRLAATCDQRRKTASTVAIKAIQIPSTEL